MQGYWSNLRAPAFRDLPDDQIAVLPLGATEQHGPHLPLSVDRDLVGAVIARALPQLAADQNVLFLPALAVTKSDEHANFPGSLWLSAETLLAVLGDVTQSVAAAGIKRLMFFNGHGGNTALLEVAARHARIQHGLLSAHASWFAFADTSDFNATALSHDIHAGDTETSAMLAARPDLVDMAQAQNFQTTLQDWETAGRQTGLTGQPARPGWIIEDLNPEGACGDASAATAEKGARLLDSAAAGLVAWLKDFQTLPLPASTPGAQT